MTLPEMVAAVTRLREFDRGVLMGMLGVSLPWTIVAMARYRLGFMRGRLAERTATNEARHRDGSS